jgi:protocatechuate 3,4-dioxygenase beta subunit
MFTAMAVTTQGYVKFNGENFEGDCATTTDILGPYYRPYAPIRTDMLVKGTTGQVVILKGKVKQKDCTTGLKNACVELWHCDEKGVYDNESPDFNYRARTYCDEKGNYEFKTVFPVPYSVGPGVTRPAHFHMLISAEGYQTLITQLYFTGDPNLSTDASSSSPAAKKRILDVKDDNGAKLVAFDVSMMEKLPADASVIERISGTYVRADNKQEEVFYKKAGMLWIQNGGSINGGYPMEYVGNNSFQVYGSKATFQFTPEKDGSVKLSFKTTNRQGEERSWTALKNK